MSGVLTADEGYSQVHNLTFVDEVGLEYGGDTQGIGDYVYDDFTLPSQTQASQSQTSQQQQPRTGKTSFKALPFCVYWVVLQLFTG